MSPPPDKIKKLAEAYTEAWCSRSGDNVASFFSEYATSIINKGVPFGHGYPGVRGSLSIAGRFVNRARTAESSLLAPCTADCR